MYHTVSSYQFHVFEIYFSEAHLNIIFSSVINSANPIHHLTSSEQDSVHSLSSWIFLHFLLSVS
jgi:hypothetical protein